MRSKYRAGWVLPIAGAPLADAWVEIEDGRIAAVGSGAPSDADDLGRAVILPSLVNAHTHLELSYLRGRIPPSPRFAAWVRDVMAARRQHPDPADPAIVEAAREAIREARRAGTGLVGDVSNTLVTVPLLRAAGTPAQVFHELTGFTEQDPVARVLEARDRCGALAVDGDEVRMSVAPHAPYSVSPALFRAIRDDLEAHPGAVSSVHLGEAPEEVELLCRGAGDLKAVLEELGRWPPDWQAPGCSPVEYLVDLGVLDGRMLAVHGVQFSGDDLARLRALDVPLVMCPRSNQHVGAGAPPIEAFYAMGVRVAIGTDSLASVGDLDLFAELAEARRLAPRVPAASLLESATLGGARALRFDHEYGSIEPGKRASLIAVRIPGDVTGVEEYLVSGVEPGDVTWLPA